MARRRIGQEHLRLCDCESSRTGSLDVVQGLIDWAAIDRHLALIYASAKGEQAWPPLSLFKALLLAAWYDLSDVKLAEALDDRASFRRFCGFAVHEPTPERTTFVRFRQELLKRGLDRVLFAAVTAQLDAHVNGPWNLPSCGRSKFPTLAGLVISRWSDRDLRFSGAVHGAFVAARAAEVG